MDRIITVLGTCNKYLCALFLASMVLIVFINTILRYLFNSGIIQAEELVRYMFVWATYLAIISVYYDNNHISVTTLTDRLSPKTLSMFSIGTNMAALYALGILTQGSVMYFFETTNIGQVTKIPYRFAVIAVVIAAASCFCIVIADTVNQWRKLTHSAKQGA